MEYADKERVRAAASSLIDSCLKGVIIENNSYSVPYKHIQTILATGQDRVQDEPAPPSSAQYGFTRGAEYYVRREKEC